MILLILFGVSAITFIARFNALIGLMYALGGMRKVMLFLWNFTKMLGLIALVIWGSAKVYGLI